MIHTSLFMELLRAEIEFWDSLDLQLKTSVGISLPQFQALEAISRIGESARVQDVSEQMSITVGATSKLIDRLERDGFAARRSHPSDRRSLIVVLTAQGRTSLERAGAAAEEHLTAVLGPHFSPSRVIALTAELSELRSAL